MPADTLSAVAPARVRALLLPAGRIKKSRFKIFVERLQQEPAVRLGDISPDGRPDRSEDINTIHSRWSLYMTAADNGSIDMFSPLAFPNGTLFYNLSTAMPPASHLGLSPFELHREPLIILGIADALEYQDIEDMSTGNGYESRRGSTISGDGRLHWDIVHEQLKEQFPRVLVVQLLMMDQLASTRPSWIPSDALCVAPLDRSTSTTIKTVMCDVSAKLLAEMAVYATAVKSLPTVQSPVYSHAPSQQEQRPVPSRRSSIRSQGSRAESPPLRASHRLLSKVPSRDQSSPPIGSLPDSRPGTPTRNGPPTSFDGMTNATIANGVSRSSSRAGVEDGLRHVSRDRFSVTGPPVPGAAERTRNMGKARVGIVVGTLYLMAGRWSDAWRELVENTARARSLGDHLWHSKGLENILACMFILAWAGFDFVIPPICYPGNDRPTSLNYDTATKDISTHLGHDPTAAGQSVARLANLLPDICYTILGFYNRANTYGDALPPPIAFDSTLRVAKLLAMAYNAGGNFRQDVLHAIVYGTKPPAMHTHYPKAIMKLSKHRIAEICFDAYPDPQSGYALNDSITSLAGITSIFGLLRLDRKKGMVLKELIATLVPALVQARKLGAAEMGIHPAASLSLASSSFDATGSTDGEVGIEHVLEQLRSTYGASEVIDDLGQTQTNGSTAADDQSTQFEALLNQAVSTAVNVASLDAYGSFNLKIDILRACVEFCEALPDLAGIVHSAALLLRSAGPHAAVEPSGSERHVNLATEEQIRLLSNMARASNAAIKSGMSVIEAAYWDDFLVRDVQLLDDATTGRLIEHAKSDLKAPKAKIKTPFLYDAFTKKASDQAKEPVIVAGEPAHVLVTLQNPYDLELQIEHISLATTGVELVVQPSNVVLGAARMQDVVLIGTAKSAGPLNIQGCHVKFRGCTQQLFPIYQQSWSAESPLRLKGAEPTENRDSYKSTSIPAKTVGSLMSRPQCHSVVARVISAQPQIIVESISLTESAMMLLEGERKSLQVVLRNTSATVTTDFLHVSFEDSLTASIRASLTSKEVSRAEMYELEIQLQQTPILDWKRLDDGPEQEISPGQVATFEISVVGRPGLSSAQILFDFAFLAESDSQVQTRFFTRQVSVPINITVNASVQLFRADLAPLPSDFAWSNQQRQAQVTSKAGLLPVIVPKAGNDRFKTLLDSVGLESGDHQEHCLFLVDIRNAWPNPLSVSMDVCEEPFARSNDSTVAKHEISGRTYNTHDMIEPGHVSRLVLLLPRIHLANSHDQIPTLSRQSERQFVVSSSKVSPEQERATREAFWYREEVLKHIRGTWKEEGSDRHGDVNLRSLRVNARMIDMIKLEDVAISMDVVNASTTRSADLDTAHSNAQKHHDSWPKDHEDEEQVTQLARSRFQVPVSGFLTLRTTLHNRSSQPIKALLRLQPAFAHQQESALDRSSDNNTEDSLTNVDVSRRFLWTGVLQRPIALLAPRETVTVELGFVVLCEGDFEIGALVEEVVVLEHMPSTVGNGEYAGGVEREEDFSGLGLKGKDRERRIWSSGEGCVIHARLGP